MRHMLHERFIQIFGTMMKKMNEVGYPREALIILGQKMNKLWSVVQGNEIKEVGDGFYPFLPVIPISFFSLEEHLVLLGLSTYIEIPFRKENPSELQEPYFITNIDDGSEFFELNVSSAELSIDNQKRKPLSDVEILSLFFHSDLLTDPFKNKMSCFASLGTKYFSYPNERDFFPMFDLQLGKLVLIEDKTKTNILCPSKGVIEV